MFMDQRHLLAAGFALLLSACQPSSPSISPTETPSLGAAPQIEPAAPDQPDTTWTVPAHPIQIRIGEAGAEFYDTRSGETFHPRGANYIRLVNTGTHYEDRLLATDQWDPDAFRADMQTLSARGYNTVRIFIDSCSSGPTCIARPDGPGLVDGYLDNLAEAMQIAQETGVYLQLTSNDIPDFGGYGEQSNREASAQITGYRNAHMLTASGHEAAQSYWEDLMQGLIERQAAFDAVLGWQLLNEQWLFGDQPPLSLTSGLIEASATGESYDMSDPAQKRDMVADALSAYISTMTATIKAHDPGALVTMGFFVPQFPNATGIGGDWYVDTASLFEREAALDYYDFHAYPGSDISFEQIVENFGMAAYPEKPVILGEYGAFRHLYETAESGARASAAYMQGACQSGFEGMLYWTYTPAPGAVGDSTWGLVDEDGYLLDLFAPATWPDPCAPLLIPTDNLALGASARASLALPDQPAANAVDGDEASIWSAGAGPVQWIEIDLGATHSIRAIRLLVAQYPEGETTHRVSVAGPDRVFSLAVEFSSQTGDSTWLEFTPTSALTGIQYLRIETTRSPSWVAWKEIEVLGE